MGDSRPELQGLITAICGVGLSKKQVLKVEEALAESYSPVAKHANGLNMIPYSLAGMWHAGCFSRKS